MLWMQKADSPERNIRDCICIHDMLSILIRSADAHLSMRSVCILFLFIQVSLQGRFHIVQPDYQRRTSFEELASLGILPNQSGNGLYTYQRTKISSSFPKPSLLPPIYRIDRGQAYEIVGSHAIEGLEILGYRYNVSIRRVSYEILVSCEFAGYINISYNSSSTLLQKLLSVSSIFSQSIFHNITLFPPAMDDLRSSPFTGIELHSPAMVKMQGNYLAASIHPKFNDAIVIYWLDNHSNPLSSNKQQQQSLLHLKLNQDADEVRLENLHMLATNNKHIRLVYNIASVNKPYRVGVSDLKFNESSQRFELVSRCTLRHPHPNPVDDEKDWSPFLLYGEVLFVKQILPLTVVSFVNHAHGRPSTCQTHTISTDERYRYLLRWKYGPLLGGSNAVYIGMGKHLAFFHSQYQLEHPGSSGDRQSSHFLGAYTFSTRHNLFRLLEISPYPILQREWYLNLTDHSYSEQHQLEVKAEGVYPMSLIRDGKELVLSLARLDGYIYVARFKLQALLAQMETLLYVDTYHNNH
jgi:hypothetical protein